MKLRFIERVAKKVNLKEQVVDFPPQPVIAKDNTTCRSIPLYFPGSRDPEAVCVWSGKPDHGDRKPDGYNSA